mmetsp:Transcript_35358/g.82650  ORF Transcript_35358/g.82650 Transcript_35358/m.82650 type:complete len:456 (-) Transcript_35358:140-1507(-)
MRRTPRALLLAALALAAYGKYQHRNARLIALLKRFLTLVASRILPIGKPKLLCGKDSTKEIGLLLRDYGSKKPLLVTDRVLIESGAVQPVESALAAAGVPFETYDGVLPNPHVDLVEEAYGVYRRAGCDGLIAVGGGSTMDLAKVVGAKVCNPKPVPAYHGAFTVTTFGLRQLPPLIAVPTTAGTGSECTVAAVISQPEQQAKTIVMDLGFIPKAAVLDPKLLLKLPAIISAATGMDALTHAIEAYVSGVRTEQSGKWCLEAVEKIYKNLVKSCKDGTDLEAREAMLLASHVAGLAFTRANVGNVHAIAHQLGAVYHTPHGLANAMVLPHMLSFYLESEGEKTGVFTCTDMFCELAKAAGLTSAVPSSPCERSALAKEFVSSVTKMREELELPTTVPGMKAADVPEIAQRALNETDGCSQKTCNPIKYMLELGYQPPRYMSLAECEEIIKKLLPP